MSVLTDFELNRSHARPQVKKASEIIKEWQAAAALVAAVIATASFIGTCIANDHRQDADNKAAEMRQAETSSKLDRLTEIPVRVDGLEKRVDVHATRLNNHDGEIGDMKEALSGVDKVVGRLDERIIGLRKSQDENTAAMRDLVKEIVELRKARP